MQLELKQHTLNKIAIFLVNIDYFSKNKDEVASALRKHEESIKSSALSLVRKCALLVLADLVEQNWRIEIKELPEDLNINSRFELHAFAPEEKFTNEKLFDVKSRIRDGHLLGVNKQLKKKETIEFVKRMQNGNKNSISIENLIDDPKDLIKNCLKNIDIEGEDQLKSSIDPYVQVASSSERDKYTNLKLQEIWKYFRLTWSLEYKTNPGRSLPILIRNRARKNHPIIGISMLASPVLGLKPRDSRMALTFKSFIDFAYKEGITLSEIIQLIDDEIKKSLRMLKYDDLAESHEIRNPNKEICNRLKTLSKISTDRKKLSEKIDGFNSEDLLFKTKRALKLKKILERKIALKQLKKDTKKLNLQLSDVDKNINFKRLIQGYISDKRTEIMASDVMDLSVCGAIFPYNFLIGGKLVALLMASTEIREYFDKRYKNSESEIAKKMAGRKIRKKSNLRCLTTTSIFGVGSSQYNRLKVSIPKRGKQQELKWEEVGKSHGYGTYHFSSNTQAKLDELLKIQGKVSSINYKFGEGTSPRLRRLRESLSNLGFKSDGFFQHQSKRITYFCDLYESTPHEIFGLKSSKPRNISQNQISKAWRKRWLEKRIHREEIQKQMKTAKIKEQLLSHKIESIESE